MKERGDIYLSEEARLRSLRAELERKYGDGKNTPTPAQVERHIKASTFQQLEPNYQPTPEDIQQKREAEKKDRASGRPGNINADSREAGRNTPGRIPQEENRVLDRKAK